MGWWWGAREDGPVGVDEEPPNGRQTDWNEASLNVVRAPPFLWTLSRGDQRSCMGYCWNLGPCYLRDLEQVVTENGLEVERSPGR